MARTSAQQKTYEIAYRASLRRFPTDRVLADSVGRFAVVQSRGTALEQGKAKLAAARRRSRV
jgi:hypothetical protein